MKYLLNVCVRCPLLLLPADGGLGIVREDAIALVAGHDRGIQLCVLRRRGS